MIVLSIDTSTLTSSVGWIELDADARDDRFRVTRHAEQITPAGPGHAETLLQRLAHILEAGALTWTDVNLIAFGRGPGTFTGLRIGLSTVKGLAISHDLPIVGVSSLEAVALGCDSHRRVAAVIDARRGELFCGIYDVTGSCEQRLTRTVVEEWVGPADAIADAVAKQAQDAPILLAGNGVSPYRDLFLSRLGDRVEIAPPAQWAPSPFWIARTGYAIFAERGPDDLVRTEPVYLREPDAKLPSVSQTGRGLA